MSLIEDIQINSLSEAYEILKGIGVDDNLFEKAHKDGDLHPNGKWVWVSSAAGGKGDWRTLNGRTHKKHQASVVSSSGKAANAGSASVNDGGVGKSTTVTRKTKNYTQSDIEQISKDEWKIGNASDGTIITLEKTPIRGYRSAKIKMNGGKKIVVGAVDNKNIPLCSKSDNMNKIVEDVKNGKDYIFDSHQAAVKFAVAFMNSESKQIKPTKDGASSKKSDTAHSTTNAGKKAVNEQKFTTKDYEHWGHASTAKSYGLFNTDTNLASIVTKDKVNSGFIVTIKKQKNKYADGSIVETKIFSSRKQAMEYGIQKIQEKVAKDKEAVNKSFDIKQIGDFISSIKTTHGDVSFISKNGAICLGKRRDYIGECDKEEKTIELGQNDLSNVKRDREAIKEISSALKEKFGFVRKITYEDNPRLGLKKAYMKIVLKPSE